MLLMPDAEAADCAEPDDLSEATNITMENKKTAQTGKGEGGGMKDAG